MMGAVTIGCLSFILLFVQIMGKYALLVGLIIGWVEIALLWSGAAVLIGMLIFIICPINICLVFAVINTLFLASTGIWIAAIVIKSAKSKKAASG